MKTSKILSYRKPSKFKGIANFDSANYQDLVSVGIDVRRYNNYDYYKSGAMDSLQPTATQSSIASPAEFLRHWLPGTVAFQTKARKIDAVAGMSIVGSWEDEEIVQRFIEHTGEPVPYNDLSNTPLSSYNTTYETRTIVRFEDGAQFAALENARDAKVGVDGSSEKRKAAAEALEIVRNKIGIFGYNNGLNRTYGYLNDPFLLPYITSPSPVWSSATFLEIQTSLLTAISALRNQTGDNYDPEMDSAKLVIAPSAIDFLSVTSNLGGQSVRTWLKETYPSIEVSSMPELDLANGGENVFYLYLNNVSDGASTDDGKVVDQLVQTKFRFNGSSINEKSTLTESYSMATAGFLLKRPIDLVRMTGI